jgi:hypothetical protein
MSLGQPPDHQDLYRSSSAYCDSALGEQSLYRLLHHHCHRLFPDHAFADLFDPSRGRPSIPPRIVAVVMILQRFEGLSDREAVDRFTFDLRWKYAAGGLDFDFPSFVHTVLVDMRARLRRSDRPNRIFEAALELAKRAGLVGRKRVLDSTALYDAVATQDTVTMIRAAIRALLRVAGSALGDELRRALQRDDDYVAPGKPVCDWDDEAAREALVDALARDGFAALAVLHERQLDPKVVKAGALLATVLGQDLEQRPDGLFRIARRVAPDRVISTVDPEARHGHKTSARGFDGYKGHIAIDPDSEIITATDVTAGNAGDAVAARALLSDVLSEPDDEPPASGAAARPADSAQSSPTTPSPDKPPSARAEVYGDAAYGTADLVDMLEGANIELFTKVQATPARKGKYSQDHFEIDTDAHTVRCPNAAVAPLRVRKDGSAVATFGARCAACPLRDACTSGTRGRIINVHRKYKLLRRARKQQQDPNWKARYRATRPKVERKIGHLMRRRHGGRRARVRGRQKVAEDFALLAAATNLKRLATLGVLRPQGPTKTPNPALLALLALLFPRFSLFTASTQDFARQPPPRPLPPKSFTSSPRLS